ncbi:hypothetical protein [Parabacteroides sp.]
MEDSDLVFVTGGVAYCTVHFTTANGNSGSIAVDSKETLDKLLKRYDQKGYKYTVTY